MKQAIIFIVIIAAVVLGLFFLPQKPVENMPLAATSFEECAAQGNAVMESYPRQCIDATGNHFVEDVTTEWEATYTNASEDLIRNVSVQAGDSITSPLIITGEARGTWFFEASFPVTIVDWDGKIIAQVPAQANGEWMTEDFVPFTATLEFNTPAGPGGPINRGAIILKNDNPSGLPERDRALEIPVVFK